ncbi:MAG: FGGY-family carbohydrate kinase [Oscillospiraceae bacterium]|jgi:xylulokinase|nr:FGGY-family carbohydrate kinase [Oscillospiraceae bacterium]
MLALCYDIGTTGVKTCLFRIEQQIEMLAGASAGYELYVLPDGGVEQDPDEWWSAMCETTRSVLAETNVSPNDIEGISFCSQMQGLVLVNQDGLPVRRAMSYMDQRAGKELETGMAYGPQIAGANIVRLLRSLRVTGAVAASVKDPVWKYKWVEAHEPDVFAKTYKWLDVKEAIIARMTGRCVMTRDSAFATLLYDIRAGKEGWSREITRMLGVRWDHLAEIVPSTAEVGVLRQAQAKELGLVGGIPVFGGGGDASLVGVGAGASALGDTHIYSGTSGWVSTVVDKSMVDTTAMIAAIVGAEHGLFNYFAEQETAGKCVEWVKDHLALDEINLYLNKEFDLRHQRPDREVEYTNLYDYLMSVIDTVDIGSGGVIFTPWLHGNRCPFEDPNARGMFFNISLETGKTEMIRAVVEGVIFHLRWLLETQDKKIKTGNPIRFVGGGALSDVMCQMMADCFGRTIETVASPQNVGSVGAAVVVAAGKGLIPSISQSKKLIPKVKTFQPNASNTARYDRCFAVYKELYAANKKLFAKLNQNERRT